MPSSPPAIARPAGRIPELDGVRAVAILLVVVWHYVHVPAAPAPHTIWSTINIFLRVTWTGVDLFFALSGFLIGGILIANRDSPDYFRVFYARRTARIFPLYLLLAGLCLVFGFPAFLKQDLPIWSIFTFTQNLVMAWRGQFAESLLTIGWSLALEEQFYLLLPPLVRFIPSRRLPAILLGMMTGGIALRWLALVLWPDQAGFACYVLLPCRWDPLLLGVFGAWVLQDPGALALADRAAGWLRAVFWILLAGLAIGTMTARMVIMSPTVTAVGYTWIGAVYALGIWLLLNGRLRWLTAALRWRWLTRIGVISYSMYLLHSVINAQMHLLWFGRREQFLTLPEALVTLTSFVVTVLVAEALWRLFEAPLLHAVQRRFRYRPPPPAPADL